MGHRKHRRIAERPRWDITPQHIIDFAQILESDLIYDDRAVPEIQEAFPGVRIENASDFIHEGRVSVEMAGASITKDQWYRFLIEQGMHEISLLFGLDRIESSTQILAWLKTWKNTPQNGVAQ